LPAGAPAAGGTGLVLGFPNRLNLLKTALSIVLDGGYIVIKRLGSSPYRIPRIAGLSISVVSANIIPPDSSRLGDVKNVLTPKVSGEPAIYFITHLFYKIFNKQNCVKITSWNL
jgi:hypothetical protein